MPICIAEQEYSDDSPSSPESDGAEALQGKYSLGEKSYPKMDDLVLLKGRSLR